MDIVAIQAALRIPEPREPSSPLVALRAFEAAVRRQAAADVEASIARRPSTMRATLKATTAVDRARAQLLAELRALGVPTEPPMSLHLCR